MEKAGAFLAELSFQLFGYGAYLLPAAVGVVGWHYFWCRKVDARTTKAIGLVLLFGSLATLLSLVVGTLDPQGARFHAGGYLGDWLTARTGSRRFVSGSLARSRA